MPNLLIHEDYNKYRRVHYWINSKYGKANKCSNPDCDGTSKHYEWANLNEKYSEDINEWKMLCRKCHSLYDKSRLCKNGHVRTDYNTVIRSKGYRHCLICRKIEKDKYKPTRRILRSKSWEILKFQYLQVL